MPGTTRCYPIGDLTPLLCAARNAKSPVPEVGAVAMRQLIEHLRPRVQRYVAPLVAGLRRPSVSIDMYVVYALVAVGASLHECTAVTDITFYAWVSTITTASVLEEHMHDAVYQLQRRRRAMTRLRRDERSDTGTVRGNAL